MSPKIKLVVVSIAFLLFSIILVGLFSLAGADEGTVSVSLAFAAGLSMIFLPCTLPLAFVIVPLTMGEKPGKGIAMAITFGIGVSITLAIYGIFMAIAGQYLGLDSATRTMFIIGGSAAFIFGLSELKLLKFTIPGFSGAVPGWIQRRKDYVKTFFMGLFLGNAGVGCPNPAFYVLLTYIATTGSVATGGLLGLVHGLGRAMPLLFLAVLGILGVNALSWVAKKKDKVDTIMGWALVAVGAFILVIGLVGMHWWEDSVFHASWNQFIYNIAPNLAENPGHAIGSGVFVASFAVGWWLIAGLILLPMIWYKIRYGLRKTLPMVIAVVLIILGLLASTGILVAEHGHGLDIESGQIELDQ